MLKKFTDFEIVRVNFDAEPKYKTILGKEGIVLSYTEHNGTWFYAVMFDNGVVSISEKYLASTGKFTTEDSIYSGEHITVEVNQKGVGSLLKKQKDIE